MTLDDLFVPGILLPGPPAFAKSEEERQRALVSLVDSMRHAKVAHALTGVLLVFLEVSGIHQMELDVGGGQKLKFSRNGTGVTYNTFSFSQEVSNQCRAWAEEQIKARFQPAEH